VSQAGGKSGKWRLGYWMGSCPLEMLAGTRAAGLVEFVGRDGSVIQALERARGGA